MTSSRPPLGAFSANWADALQAIAHSVGGRVLRDATFVATDVGRPAGLENAVVLLQPLDRVHAEPVMSRLETFFGLHDANAAGTVYLFTAWSTLDLAPFGWELVEQTPLMMRPAQAARLPATPDMCISEVRTLKALHQFERVIVDGFPAEDLQGGPPGVAFGPALLHDPRARFWLGWQGQEPVSAAAAYVAHGVVHLTFLATLPQARGRGFGSALAWQATLADSKLPAMLMASQAGRPLYERLGYRELLDVPLWTRQRPLRGTGP